jgi:Raf kinase inhibitor-like YbhB/YbcL family protein
VSRAPLLAVAALLVSCLACSEPREGAPQEDGMPKLVVESSVFKAGGSIPEKYTCDGDDVSPPLSWSAGPAGTAAYALIMDDPDAPMGTWVHWVAWNLPGTSLPAGVPKEARHADGTRQGHSSWKRAGYGGPCPPSGTHRYVFRVYALDARLDLPDATDKAALLGAIEGHVLAQGELVGRYTHH